MPNIEVKIDLVTRPAEGGCKLILVEFGPWNDEEKQQNLQRLGRSGKKRERPLPESRLTATLFF